MKLFLDTNIIIDLITGREPFGRDAAILFQLGRSGNELIVSDLSVFNTVYVLQKLRYAKEDIYDILVSLLPTLTVTSMGVSVVERCILRRGKDFEDDAQFFAAVDAKADFIITRNKKDFPSDDSVVEPQEFFKLMNICS
ncbi:MAG: PIN domain-containing protein [Prevotella sp.]|nr:PIN domain-containing protein [Prevotella sp.]MBQ3752192.1 PIN domain-containing protein [Prevotella sp.]